VYQRFSADGTAAIQTPLESLEVAYEKIRRVLKIELLERLANEAPAVFIDVEIAAVDAKGPLLLQAVEHLRDGETPSSFGLIFALFLGNSAIPPGDLSGGLSIALFAGRFFSSEESNHTNLCFTCIIAVR
jgi:hypothetical protein